MRRHVPRYPDGFGERPAPGRTVVRYVALVAFMGAALLCFLLLHSATVAVLAATTPTAGGVAARYRASLVEKVLIIGFGVSGMAGIIVTDWYYAGARGMVDLLQRFARTMAIIAFLLGFCHGVFWLVGSRDALTIGLCAGGLALGATLLVLSLLGRCR